MFQRLGQIFVIVALLAALGTHWVVLQSVAWTTMLADNLRTGSVSEAVQRTFDGKHPCCLCKKIAEGKKAEKKTVLSFELKKFEFAHAQTRFVFLAPSAFSLLPSADHSAHSKSEGPPTPPPRMLHG